MSATPSETASNTSNASTSSPGKYVVTLSRPSEASVTQRPNHSKRSALVQLQTSFSSRVPLAMAGALSVAAALAVAAAPRNLLRFMPAPPGG